MSFRLPKPMASSPSVTAFRAVGRYLAGIACAMLVACTAEISGSPTPPPEFGPVSKSLFGCPTVRGVYAWPPSAGDYAGGIATNQEPWEGGIPVPARRGRMQIWVTQTPTGMIFRSRSAYVQKGLSDRLTKEWSYAEYDRGAYACSSGMLDVKAVDIE